MYPAPLPPSPIALRSRQQEALERVFSRLEQGVSRQMVALPTGYGKTIFGLTLGLYFPRTLFLVPREELLEQTVASIERVAPGESVGIIRGRRFDLHARFVVGMIQTVYSRLEKIPRDAFPLVINDEAHHSGAKTHRQTLEHFKHTLRLGLSATPERADGVPLSNLFDEVSYEVSIADAVREGVLVRPQGLRVETETTLEAKTLAGDFSEKDMQRDLDIPARNYLIAEKWLEQAAGRKTLAFTSGIKHAQNLTAAMCERGIRAEWVSGDDGARADKIARFKRGELDVLCNAMILTEGFDDPGVSCILMARPTQSRTLYIQMAGRGMRQAPGKIDCLIIDFADNVRQRLVVDCWDFIGSKLKKSVGGRPRDLVAALEESQSLSVLIESAQGRLDLDLSLESIVKMIDLLEPLPPITARAWKFGSSAEELATPAQLRTLEQLGYDVLEHGEDSLEWTRAQASATIAQKRFEQSPPASKAMLRKVLSFRGDVLRENWSHAQAEEFVRAKIQSGSRPDSSFEKQVVGTKGKSRVFIPTHRLAEAVL